MTSSTTSVGRTNSIPIHVGFMPLVDCAPIVIAKELGFDREEGLELQLHKEVSWSNIRDKVIVGQFDCAHMLAPMPLAASLGLNHVREAVITPMTLSFNGNAITVSRTIYSHMLDVSPKQTRSGAWKSGDALALVLKERRKHSARPMTFGIVYPFSCQHYELRFWLSKSGIDPDRDIRLIGLPPSLMVESLIAGQIDGFCAGEPWNSAAVESKAGAMVATKEEVWGLAPEKVLGVRLSWAECHAEALYGMIRATLKAAAWLSIAENHSHAGKILSQAHYVGQSEDIIGRSLRGKIIRDFRQSADTVPSFLRFATGTESCPSRHYMAWLLSMMYVTGQLDRAIKCPFILDDVARIDLWETATERKAESTTPLDVSVARTAGFDPEDINGFLDNVRASL